MDVWECAHHECRDGDAGTAQPVPVWTGIGGGVVLRHSGANSCSKFWCANHVEWIARSDFYAFLCVTLASYLARQLHVTEAVPTGHRLGSVCDTRSICDTNKPLS